MKQPRKTMLTLSGMIGFFMLVALIMQTAILIYDYTISKTQSKGLIFVIITVTVIVLSLLVCIMDLVRRKIMIERPVEKIIDATEKIASGDFNVRLEIDRVTDKYNEFDVIMENLNIMAKELSKSEILKTDFISNISHEIKTPLSIIQSYALLLQNESLDDKTRKKYTEILISASKRLSSLVTNILQLNKLENQVTKPQTSTFMLNDLIANAVIENENLIENKGIELDVDLDEIGITTVRSYIEIIVSNLLSNAIKFTERGGKISVSLKKENEWNVITVSDTGCGISSDTGARIFEKFYQEDTSHATQGNGLGLALVKRVIDILGGEILVQSELGSGSTFIVKLK